MPVDLRVQSPIVKVGGKPLDDALVQTLTDVRIELELSLPARCELRFVDSGFAHAEKAPFGIDALVSVSFPAPGGAEAPVFDGEVTDIGIDVPHGEVPHLTVVALDASHRLARVARTETYQETTCRTVLNKIAGRNGLSLKVGSGMPGFTVPLLFQAGTDYDLLSELAARYGLEWWVEGTALNVGPAQQGAQVGPLELGARLLSFNARASGGRGGKVTVNGWDPTQQKAVTANADSAKGGAPAPEAPWAASTGSTLKSQAYARTTLTHVFGSSTPDETKAVAQGIAAREQSAQIAVRGEAIGEPTIRPGVVVKVERVGPLSGSYPVTRAEHRFGRGDGYTTRFESGERVPSHLVDLLGAGGGGRHAAPVPSGFLVGTVTNVNDPEALGRIRVKFPTLAADHESAWARVVSLGGGKDRGTVFLPEVNDEVLVGFEHGDFRSPVVIGGLFSKKNAFPKVALAGSGDSAKVASRVIRSRTGHTITLLDDDNEKKQAVEIVVAGQKQSVHVGRDAISIESAEAIPFEIKIGTASIAISKQGDITVKGKNITFDATQNVTVRGTAVNVEGKQAVAMKGGASKTEIGAKGVEVSGVPMVAVKGPQVKIN